MKSALFLFTIIVPLLSGSSDYSVFRATQNADNPGKPVPVTPLGPARSGPRESFTAFSGIEDRVRVVIRDQDAWRDIWKRIHSPVSEVPPLPEIDFSREMIVVAALGSRPSGGFAIIIDGAYERDDRLEIIVRSVSPGKGCMSTAVVTTPVDIVKLPKMEHPVVFRETEVVHECK